jgi:glycosyltransferase involved in cell wall biosynthesis
MGYDHAIEAARGRNPHIKIILADPKLGSPKYIRAAREADMLLVSSVEQRDAFLRLNQNVIIYYMFPETPFKPRTHADTGRTIVAYHGNRVHLEAMRYSVMPAMVALAATRPVEFHAIYNIQHLGQADLSLLENGGVAIKQIQWDSSTVLESLRAADIGIMPNELPIRNRLNALASTAYPEGEFAYEPFDHFVRYKVSANPGRLYPFACAGVPVVADFAPSASQFIRDGVSGFVASSPHGWYYALARLAESAPLRRTCAERLWQEVDGQYRRQVDDFISACQASTRTVLPAISGHATAEEEQKMFHETPKPSETVLRWGIRQLNRLWSRLS